jgi:hypothetical protein
MAKSSTQHKPKDKETKLAQAPQTAVPPVTPPVAPTATAPVSQLQSVPGSPPTPPSGPAAPAAKSKPKRGLDLSGLSDEARAKVESLRKSLDEEKKKVTKELAERERREFEALGIKMPEKKTAAKREAGTTGINENFIVTAAPNTLTGFDTNDTVKGVRQTLLDKGGVTLKEFLNMDGVDGIQFFRYRFFRGSILLNGKTFAEVLNKGAA